ncbi:MAG: hypothetical protein JXA99_01225 [Candidatus Lokiarchaeota archaeon]|nr:hypothetical protein [Candidatus Lokiarchaeota archaeon]
MVIKPKVKNIPSLFYIKISLFIMAALKFFDSLATLNYEICAITVGILSFPAVFFAVIGINYTIKDTSKTYSLYLVFAMGILLLYLAFQPGGVTTIEANGFKASKITGVYRILFLFITAMYAIYMFYWGLKTRLNVPILIKKEGNIFFIGVLLCSIITISFQFMIQIHYIFLSLTDITVFLGLGITIYAIYREPKLLYILPFRVNRLLVKNNEGYPLYDHDWAESNLNEITFTGFLNTIQTLSEEVINIGSLVDIHLDEGIVILNKAKYITIGLVATKSSKLLRTAVSHFSKDFEDKFERILKKGCVDMSEYQSAYELILKYFSNFPYRFVKDKKHPLLLSYKKLSLPQFIEEKYKNLFRQETEYEDIHSDLAKSPISLSEEFLEFYNENVDELEELDTKFNILNNKNKENKNI